MEIDKDDWFEGVCAGLDVYRKHPQTAGCAHVVLDDSNLEDSFIDEVLSNRGTCEVCGRAMRWLRLQDMNTRLDWSNSVHRIERAASRGPDSLPENPDQPLHVDKEGTIRFRKNAIVRHLLDHGGMSLNMLSSLQFSDEDWKQFAQLIGYSVNGYCELDYISEMHRLQITLEHDHIIHARKPFTGD